MMEFRNLLVGLVAAGMLAGCASLGGGTPASPQSPKKDLTEPEMVQLADPNPFANYGPAMQSSDAFPLTVNWQDAHKAEIAAATSPETLLRLLRKNNGKGLLDELRAPYHTDPIVMQQIAAMSQVVMDPATPNAANLRACWTKTLIAKIHAAKAYISSSQTCSAYHALFCLDQLRWCACPEDAKALREIAKWWNNGNADDTRHVREFAAQVEREVAR